MRLKTEKFDKLATEYGYDDGFDLLERLGYDEVVCEMLYCGYQLGYELAFRLCRCFGVKKICKVINFGKRETKYGLISKYYKG